MSTNFYTNKHLFSLIYIDVCSVFYERFLLLLFMFIVRIWGEIKNEVWKNLMVEVHC